MAVDEFEAPSRIVVSFAAGDEAAVRKLAATVPFAILGRAGGDTLTVRADSKVLVARPVKALALAHRGGLKTALGL